MRRRDLLLALVVLLLLWQLLAMALNQQILPSPVHVGRAVCRELGRGDACRCTSWPRCGACWPAWCSRLHWQPRPGWCWASRRLNKLFSPFIYLTYPIPKVVLVPVVLLFLGVGDLAKIVIIFLILFFQILVLVRDQAAGLRPELIQSVRSLGAGRRALFRFVYLPASLPAILTGVRQSIGTAVAVLYVAELFATQRGLGYYIYLSGSTLLDYPAMYAGIVAMSALGAMLYWPPTSWKKRYAPGKYKHEIHPFFL
jgi:ABC-type nitrate/sulfonate/bicarbonate transport system permease component